VRRELTVILSLPSPAILGAAKDLCSWLCSDELERNCSDPSMRSPENHHLGVIPAQAGIHVTWAPAFAGATGVRIFIPSGGPQAHGNSVESHVAKKRKFLVFRQVAHSPLQGSQT
jgi:hypothetical protein